MAENQNGDIHKANSMRLLIAMYAGTLAFSSSAGILAFSEPPASNTLQSDSASRTHSVTPETDLTGGEAGLTEEEDADTPVRQGKLE